MKNNTTIISAKKDILRAIYSKAVRGLHYPTAVVGIGGTGLKVTRQLKRMLQRHDAPDIELVGIDSDIKENGRWPELPPLTESELILLDPAEAVGALAKAAAGHESHKFILDFLPNEHGNRRGLHASVMEKIRRGDGAGQWGRSGRLLAVTNMTSGANLQGRFEILRDKLLAMRERLRQEGEGLDVASTVKVIVTCSLGGGMGAGSVADILALIRKIFGAQAEITLFVILPGRLLDRVFKQHEQPKVTRRTALGSLRQLLALTSAPEGHTFEWGPAGQFTITQDNLLDGIYLVGHTLKNGVVVNEYMELTEAVSLGLYSFLGSGVGADVASDAINGFLPENPHHTEPVKKFHALGIAALSYAVDDLANYGTRHTAGQWMVRWLTWPANRTEVDPALGAAQDSLKLRSLEQFREHFPTASHKVSFKTSAEARADFLKRGTAEFLHESKDRLQRYGDELKDSASGVDPQLQSELNDIVPQLQQNCDAVIRTNLSVTHAQAYSVAAGLMAQVKTLRSRLLDEQPRTNARLKELRVGLDNQERSIKLLGKIPLGLGGGKRRNYLDGVNESLRLMLQDKVDAHVSQALAALEQHLAKRLNDLDQLRGKIQRHADANAQVLTDIDATKERPGFVQHVIPRADYRKWVENLGVELPGAFTVEGFSLESLMEPVLDRIVDEYRGVAMKLDLPKALGAEQAQARENPDHPCPLTNKLRSLDTASEPIIELTALSPSGSHLSPQKFVAAAGLNAGDENILPHFSQPGLAAVQSIAIQNPHLVVCSHLIHGFAVTHWPVFAEENAGYMDDQWYYHTLPGAEKFPPLEPLNQQARTTLQTFGTGLMLGVIEERHHGFHVNIKRTAHTGNGSPSWGFKTFRREPCAGAKLLLDSHLVSPADEHAVEPRSEDLLGADADMAIKKLATADGAALADQIHRLADTLEAKAGAGAVKRIVDEFVTGLPGRLNNSKFGRRIENDLATALHDYASHLR